MMEEDILEQALGADELIIYGAHLVALECARWLIQQGMRKHIIGFAVTDCQGNPNELEGLPVREIDEYREKASRLLVIIATPVRYHSDIERYGRERGFGRFLKVGLEDMSRIKGKRLIWNQKDYPQMSFILEEDENDESWLNMVWKKNNHSNYCKFPTLFYLEEEKVFKEAVGFDIQNKYENLCGGSQNLYKLPVKCLQETDDKEIKNIINIYMAFSQWDIGRTGDRKYEPWIRPIQVGSSMSEQRTGNLFDDTGDHISEENGRFAEMTGAYWIWKNGTGSEYKGLCHYRRHFVISREQILSLDSNKIDVVLTMPRYVPGGIGNMFLAETPVKDNVYKGMLEAIGELKPEDRESFEKYLDSCFYYPNNMVVAKSRIYDNYCGWLFPILFRMAEIDVEMKYGHWQDRHIAYAAELLTSYYFMKNKGNYCIAVTDYRLDL